MDQIKEQLQKNTAILDPYAVQIPPLKDGAEKLKVNPGLILGGILSVVFLIIMCIKGWAIVMTCITVLYPAVHSIRAIESPEEDDDKVWLTYWMVFGVLTVAETFLGFIFYFIPYWGWIRLVLFIWLLMPQTKGSETVYNAVVKPLLASNKQLIEDWVNKAKEAAEQAAAEAREKALNDPALIAQAVSLSNKGMERAKAAAKTASGDGDEIPDEPIEASN